MKNNFAGCVILYNATEDEIKNIETYSSKVNTLYVYDNTETKSNEHYFKQYSNVNYFWDNENKGIATRLNQACVQAINDGYNYMLSMDQDSSFKEENIDQYFNAILNFKEKEKVAVYGLEYVKKDINEKTHEYSEVDHLITSASVINLNLFYTIGKFDENLFIDGVDIDYCYAALLKDFKNIKFGKIYFNHYLGSFAIRGSIFSLYLFKKKMSIHSSLRIYYMYRNMLYIEKKHKRRLPNLINKFVKNQKYHINKNIKYSHEFFTVLKFKRKAILDFKNNQMGKFKSSILIQISKND